MLWRTARGPDNGTPAVSRSRLSAQCGDEVGDGLAIILEVHIQGDDRSKPLHAPPPFNACFHNPCQERSFGSPRTCTCQQTSVEIIKLVHTIGAQRPTTLASLEQWGRRAWTEF